jgi:hypothetical protein
MPNTMNQVTLLQLAAAQLALSMKETEQPFNNLSRLFIDIVEGFNQIEKLLSRGEPSDIKHVTQLHKTTQKSVQNAIIDFQFYDRMTQRLNHIMQNIQDTIFSIENKNETDDKQWESIFMDIEKSYTMEEEKQLYLSIRSGIGFDQAMKNLITQTFQKQDVAQEIELF